MKYSKKNALARLIIFLAKGYIKEYHNKIDSYNNTDEEISFDKEKRKYIVIVFNDNKNMHKARMEYKEKVVAYYEFDDESYIVLPYNEDENYMDIINKYDARYLLDEELNNYIDKTSIEGKYVCFVDSDDLQAFLEMSIKMYGEQRIMFLQHDDTFFVSFENLDEKLKFSLKYLAYEYMGNIITDMYEDRCLDYLFYG